AWLILINTNINAMEKATKDITAEVTKEIEDIMGDTMEVDTEDTMEVVAEDTMGDTEDTVDKKTRITTTTWSDSSSERSANISKLPGDFTYRGNLYRLPLS
ncbi:hypothetical protein FO519_010105, partial [Halicephalobus sp. NKZ332]